MHGAPRVHGATRAVTIAAAPLDLADSPAVNNVKVLSTTANHTGVATSAAADSIGGQTQIAIAVQALPMGVLIATPRLVTHPASSTHRIRDSTP